MARRRFNIPQDLPSDWQDIQYLSASGDAFTPPDEKRGYNYLSARINELAEAINSLSSAEEDWVFANQGEENPHRVIATTEEGRCLAHILGRSLEIDEENHTLQCKKLVSDVQPASGGLLFSFNDGSSLSSTTVLAGWQPRRAYVVGDIARSPQLKSYEYLQCTKAGTSGDTFTLEMINQKVGGTRVNDGTCQWRKKDWRCKHNTGDIVEKIGTPAAYEYLIELAGQTLSTTTYYELTQHLGKTTLPNSRGRVTWHNSGSQTDGSLLAPGLPNITGTNTIEFSALADYYTRNYMSGNKNVTATKLGNVPSGEDYDFYMCRYKIDFTASGGGIYGKSTTVQPPAVVVKRYICYA